MRSMALIVSVVWLVSGCGDDGGGGGADARPTADGAAAVDAGPKVYCFNLPDEMCNYVPTELTVAEMSLADQLALARKYVPAHVYSGAHVWAVSVDILLEDGGPLMRAEHSGRVAYSYNVDEATSELVYAEGTQPDLTTTDWSGLPTMSAGGKPLTYFIDYPGDNTGNMRDQETWSTEWQTIQGSDDPLQAKHKPHQYAHFFWLSKADRLLAIQFWSYYPYDKFINNHEGDWEHINVVLDYPEGGTPTLAFIQLGYHGNETGFLPETLYRIKGRDGTGDHPVIFIGGDTCVVYPPDTWCGGTSGGNFPFPGNYSISYDEVIKGDVAAPGRLVHADDYQLTLLPRIDDVDYAASPELSWYKLPFLAGAPTVDNNSPVTIATNNHRAPVHPAPDHDEYDVGIEGFFDLKEAWTPKPFVAPAGWDLINEPPASVFGN